MISRRSILAAAAAAPLCSGVASGQDYRIAELAHPKTQFTLLSWNTRAEWERHRARVRQQILGAAGLLPHMQQGNLPVHSIRRTRHDTYSTESLRIETLPGFTVGATVYFPNDTTRRRPAVLIPHGHWKRGRVEHLPSYSVPALAINLALQGYVALTWDMLGYNDTSFIPHDFGGWREQLWSFNPLGLQLWNSIRMLDHLASRPDVDHRRIACTGASGGATQTILLCAVDGRVACSAPVNMISASYQGADPCEEAPNLRLDTNNVEFASMMAPRPMLVVSCTGDWTRNTPHFEFPAIERVYRLYDRPELVSNAHFDAEHNYDRRTRGAVYKFLAKHLLDQHDWQWTEREIGEISTEELLSASPVLPSEAKETSLGELFDQWQALARRQTASAPEPALRLAMASALMTESPELVGSSVLGGRLILNRVGKRDRVLAKWSTGRGNPAILVHPDGSEAAMDTAEYRKLCHSQRPVLLPDLFQTGLALAQRERGGRWYLSYNQTDDANRIQDILTAIAWIRSQTAAIPELIGLGRAALWVLFAASVTRGPVSVVADIDTTRVEEELLKEGCFVPGIQRAGGIAAALRLVHHLRPAL